jgi:NADH-quinone oxidoreductase subunit A
MICLVQEAPEQFLTGRSNLFSEQHKRLSSTMSYIPVLILMAIGIFLGAVIITLSGVLGPKIKNKTKETAFECGMPAYGNTKQRFSVRFYLVAILFLLFDVEAVFFFPFAVVYKKYLTINEFILLEMGVFVAILLVGYFYVLGKGALEWE